MGIEQAPTLIKVTQPPTIGIVGATRATQPLTIGSMQPLIVGT
jgi:hypothetical protein